MPRHVLTLLDIDPSEAVGLLDRADELKADRFASQALAGKTVILIFEKASTRTRVSFEVGVRQMGGETLFLTPGDSQLGRDEPLEDTARVLSRYADCLVVRTFGQDVIVRLAQAGSIPVVNALTDDYHPCQILADAQTMRQKAGDLRGLPIAWVGDGNNMAHSFINGAVLFGWDLRMACPEGFMPKDEVLDKAKRLGARVFLTTEPAEAVAGAKFVHTDVWASMGQEGESKTRAEVFKGYQVDEALMALADPSAYFMHCLPAHRGEEVSAAVMDSEKSIVFDQAESRLHAQKALLEWVMQR